MNPSSSSPQLHLARADELRQLQRYDLALHEVARALALEPHASAPHVCAAWILRDQKRLAEAEQAARAALSAEPNDPDAQHILAVTLWEQGRREEARQAFDATLALSRGNRTLYLTNYARMMTTYRRYHEALVALNLADQALVRHRRGLGDGGMRVAAVAHVCKPAPDQGVIGRSHAEQGMSQQSPEVAQRGGAQTRQ